MMLQNLERAKIAPFSRDTQSDRFAILFKIHLTNSIDLAINDIWYEYYQDEVCLDSFDWVFVHKEVRLTNKTETKDVL